MIHEQVTGVVLAGGKSNRMGRDKALMTWQGKPLILHAIGILQQVCKHVVISANTHDYDFTGYAVWPDEVPIPAPITGIYSCLKRSADKRIMLLSCDMPLVDPGLLDHLLTFDQQYDVIVPVHGGHCIEPLCGLYHRRVMPLLEKALHDHQFSLQQCIRKSNTKLVEIRPDAPFFSPDMFLNINTLSDFKKLSGRIP